MLHISGTFVVSGKLSWNIHLDEDGTRGIILHFNLYRNQNKRQALTSLRNLLAKNEISWLQPNRTVIGDWVLDTEALRKEIELDENFAWFRGNIIVAPEVERIDESTFTGDSFMELFRSSIQFVILEEEIGDYLEMAKFPELAPFIEAFKQDQPDKQTCGFIMMKFTDTDLHKSCLSVIREVCAEFGLTILRADDKTYSDDLLGNVRTYMHGCGFGIALYERLTEDEFNPNVSLEVGYMLALGKPVLLLKDRTLGNLQTDLMGRLYSPFDTQHPKDTIPAEIEKWLRDKGIIQD